MRNGVQPKAQNPKNNLFLNTEHPNFATAKSEEASSVSATENTAASG